MTTNGWQDAQLLSEASPKRQSKPALGAPHDILATVCLALAFSAFFFFAGRAWVEGDALGWTGMSASVVVMLVSSFYFRRAYGLASAWSGATVPWGVIVAAGCFGIIGPAVPDALYQQYFANSVVHYALICLATATLPIAVLHAALGKASPAK